MQMGHWMLVCGLVLGTSACKKEKSGDALVEETAAPAQSEATGDAVKAEPALPLTCKEKNIPSYELVIKDLSALRCDSCHNETFAWKGIVLTQYDAWVTYKKAIWNRVYYNFLTQPLEEGEKALFLSFVDNGTPRTENDCSPTGMTP